MIYRLLDQIVKGKPDGFPNMLVGALTADGKPGIAIYPGQLQVSQTAHDSSSAPRLQDYVQEAALAKNKKNYKLDQIPLDGSLTAEMVTNEGKVNEQRDPLVLTDDYTIDPTTPQITLTDAGKTKTAAADSLIITYAFVGTLALQEFTQFFNADIRAASPGDAEQWSSLLVAYLLTSHDALIDAYNAAAVNYTSGDFVSRHLLGGFSLQQGTTDIATDSATVHLTFQATGRLELARVKPPSFDLIEQVVSLDRTGSKQPVDVGVKVD